MMVRLSDYIVSPLAMGTHANYLQVKAGRSCLRLFEGKWELPEPVMASMMDNALLDAACGEIGLTADHTRFERMAILAAAHALRAADVDAKDARTLFVVATTKGNVELLDEEAGRAFPADRASLVAAARQVSGWFGNPNEPVVVSNACISGLSAQIEAQRVLDAGTFDTVVLVGADVLSPFVVSGFQSFKALSASPCRPFDEDRCGLNLGEAAACIVYGRAEAVPNTHLWHAVAGVVRNDAFHISSPSKTAEGAYRALRALTETGCDYSDVACVNVHGTATMFNDEMEAVALHRMGLGSMPAFGLKGYYGHTMGAAGVLETLVAMEAMDDSTVPATKGYCHAGVSRQVDLSAAPRQASGMSFVKMMSGFGGCNAAMWFRKGGCRHELCPPSGGMACRASHTVELTTTGASVDGRTVEADGTGVAMLKSLYHRYVGDYPKFYKMDLLGKLAFIASELLLQAEAETDGNGRFTPCEDRAVVLAGRSASICADLAFQQTIQHADDYYPSPSAFVYTLPNIAAGEIAIRNRYHGETAYLAVETPAQVDDLLRRALRGYGTSSVLGGWINADGEDSFETKLYIIK